MLGSTLACFAAATSLILLTFLAEVEAQQQPHYFVGDEVVTLQPSPNFRAFKVEGDAERVSSLRQSLSESSTIQQHSLLEKYNIFLVRRTSSVAPSSIPQSLMMLQESSGNSASDVFEAPVFSATGVDQVLVNEFVVQFKVNVETNESTELLAQAQAEIIEWPEKLRGRYTITFPQMDELHALAASNTLHRHESVEYSQPNFVRIFPARPAKLQQRRSSGPMPCLPSKDPNDELYSCQWALSNDGSVGLKDADIDADGAWQMVAVATEKQSVIVAIIDVGVDINHEDLAAKVVTPYDAMDRDNDQQPNGPDSHGTACAGIAAAISNNALGIAGVDGGTAKILPVRIATGGSGNTWITSDAIIEDGLRTAVDRGAHVLSNSWGGGLPSNLINSGIRYALDGGRIVVFATGNSFSSTVGYPASLSQSSAVIAVGATNQWDELKSPNSQDGETWWGSNYGDAVSVVAPGVQIHTTDNSGNDGYDSTDYFAAFNGTSSATPHVAGIAALMLSVNPELTPVEVRSILQATAEDLGDPGFDIYYGHGRVNAERAVAASIAK